MSDRKETKKTKREDHFSDTAASDSSSSCHEIDEKRPRIVATRCDDAKNEISFFSSSKQVDSSDDSKGSLMEESSPNTSDSEYSSSDTSSSSPSSSDASSHESVSESSNSDSEEDSNTEERRKKITSTTTTTAASSSPSSCLPHPPLDFGAISCFLTEERAKRFAMLLDMSIEEFVRVVKEENANPFLNGTRVLFHVNWKKNAVSLVRNGVNTFRLFTELEMVAYQLRLELALCTAPDAPKFARSEGFAGLRWTKDEKKVFVGGGLQALGSVTASYHPVVRQLRKEIGVRLRWMLLFELGCMKHALLVRFHNDRCIVAPFSPGTLKSGDYSNAYREYGPDDLLAQFSGSLAIWRPQTFSCFKGTQFVRTKDFRHAVRNKSGRYPQPKIDQDDIMENLSTVHVDIGEVVVFFSHILQLDQPRKWEDDPQYAQDPMISQLFGFSLADSPPEKSKVHIECVKKDMMEQRPFRLQSTKFQIQIPDQYYGFNHGLMVEISSQFPDEICYDYSPKSGKRCGLPGVKVIRTVAQTFEEAGITTPENPLAYPPVSDHELLDAEFSAIIQKTE
jgi:hypothetical protein